jgi:predicted enzyme related to lactoylglutathione lyase
LNRPHPLDLNYITLYYEDFEEAVQFYSQLFGPPEVGQQSHANGWRMGATWLTLFRAKAGPTPGANPCGTEFAVQVADPQDVDDLYRRMMELGAAEVMPPQNTEMYEPMRFACVDEPLGVRIDIYCRL